MARAATVGTAVVLALAATLTACTDEGGSAQPSPSPSSASSTGSAEPQTLRFSVYGGPAEVRAYRALADRFEADNPGVKVVIKDHSDAPSAAEDAFADLSARASATASPSTSGSDSPATTSSPSSAGPRQTPPDVFMLDQHYLPDLVSTGQLHPLDAELEERGIDFGDDFQRIALTAFSADSALQCMPFEMSPSVLFVNKDLVRYPRLEAAGIALPSETGTWRWEDFDAAARLVARPGRPAVHLPADADLLSALMLSAGGDIVDDYADPGSLDLDSGAGREVLTAYADLARDRSVTLSTRQARRVDPRTRFAEGRLPFLFGNRSDVPALRESGVRFDALAVPGFGRARTSSAISGLCVDANSEARDTAVDFVAHAVSEESLDWVARTGAFVPAHLDAANSPAFEQPNRRPRTVAPFLEGQKRSVLMPYSLGWRLAETRIEELMGRLAAGSPRDIESQLERELPAIDEESEAIFEDAKAAEESED